MFIHTRVEMGVLKIFRVVESVDSAYANKFWAAERLRRRALKASMVSRL